MSGRKKNLAAELSLKDEIQLQKEKKLKTSMLLELGSDLETGDTRIFDSAQMRSLGKGILQTDKKFIKHRKIRQKAY
jgi:hypothetical protein